MKHYGDISQIHGGKIEPVDIITFGSPCTDLSVAGKRAGLEGKQSSLFFQAIRIITEMRNATNEKYPRFIVWENVAGAFSSNGGADFKAVLDTIIGIVRPDAPVPLPEKNRWPYADLYLGDGWSLAYRTLDAQFWGVPQRRRRIYLVADFAGTSAGEILFKSEGLSGYSSQGFQSWQTTAARSAGCVRAAGGICLNDQGGSSISIEKDVAPTLRAESHQHLPCVIPAQHPDVKAYHINQRMEGIDLGDKAGAIMASRSDQMQTFVLQGSMIGRSEKNGPQGSGISENVTFTLNTVDKHAVACPSYSTSKTYHYETADKELANTLVATDYKSPPIVGQTMSGKDFFGTLMANAGSKMWSGNHEAFSGDYHVYDTIDPHYIVRRLTPTECARLQGFPDWWCCGLETADPSEEEIHFWTNVFETHRLATGSGKQPKSRRQIVSWLKSPNSDSAEYKMWGNGVALPCVYFVLSGIVWAMNADMTTEGGELSIYE